MIQSRNFEERMCTLVDTLGTPVVLGQHVTDNLGETWAVTGGLSPQNSQAPGHVWGKHVIDGYERTFYVAMFGMRWEARGEE